MLLKEQDDNLDDNDDALQRKVCPQLLPSLWDSPATKKEEEDKETTTTHPALSSSCVCNNDKKEETASPEQVACYADLMLYNQDDNADISMTQSVGIDKTTGDVQWQTHCYHISYPNNDKNNNNDEKEGEDDNDNDLVDRTLCLTERYGPTKEQEEQGATTQGQRDPLPTTTTTNVSGCQAEFSQTEEAVEPKCQPLPRDNNEWPPLLRDRLEEEDKTEDTPRRPRNCYKLVLETTEGFADTTYVCPPVDGLSQTHGPSGGWMVVSDPATTASGNNQTMEQQLRVPDSILSDFDNQSNNNSTANENNGKDMVQDENDGATTTTVFVGEVPKDAVVPQKNPSLSSSSDSAAWSACLVVVAIMVLVCGLARHHRRSACARRRCRRKSCTKQLHGRRGHRKGSFSSMVPQQHGHHIPLAFQDVDDEDHTEETQGEDDDEEEDELAAEVVFV